MTLVGMGFAVTKVIRLAAVHRNGNGTTELISSSRKLN